MEKGKKKEKEYKKDAVITLRVSTKLLMELLVGLRGSGITVGIIRNKNTIIDDSLRFLNEIFKENGLTRNLSIEESIIMCNNEMGVDAYNPGGRFKINRMENLRRENENEKGVVVDNNIVDPKILAEAERIFNKIQANISNMSNTSDRDKVKEIRDSETIMNELEEKLKVLDKSEKEVRDRMI
jgi:hypothetical protein